NHPREVWGQRRQRWTGPGGAHAQRQRGEVGAAGGRDLVVQAALLQAQGLEVGAVGGGDVDQLGGGSGGAPVVRRLDLAAAGGGDCARLGGGGGGALGVRRLYLEAAGVGDQMPVAPSSDAQRDLKLGACRVSCRYGSRQHDLRRRRRRLGCCDVDAGAQPILL